MACPICTSPDGATINAAMRAGAGVLILVATVVIGLICRFAIRLWAAERSESVDVT
jgi:hypothetical protein